MISVILLTLNEEDSLAATLDSIYAAEGDCEIIVTDGGSRIRGRDRIGTAVVLGPIQEITSR